MKIEEATIMYISYRMSLGERARTLKFIMNNFCNYIIGMTGEEVAALELTVRYRSSIVSTT